jgi:hypothetical protein
MRHLVDLGHEGEGLMIGISVLIKETLKKKLTLPIMGGHRKGAICGPGSRPSLTLKLLMSWSYTSDTPGL